MPLAQLSDAGILGSRCLDNPCCFLPGHDRDHHKLMGLVRDIHILILSDGMCDTKEVVTP